MRRLVYYGYDEDGGFVIKISETSVDGGQCEPGITELTRAECQKISKHMQFGRKGEERVIETVNGEVVK